MVKINRVLQGGKADGNANEMHDHKGLGDTFFLAFYVVCVLYNYKKMLENAVACACGVSSLSNIQRNNYITASSETLNPDSIAGLDALQYTSKYQSHIHT